MRILKKIGLIIDITSFCCIILSFTIKKKIINLDFIFFIFLIIGTIIQIPAQINYIKNNKDVDYLDRRYLFGLFLGVIVFIGILIFLVLDSYK